MSCNCDYSFIEGYDPSATLTRTTTLMDGGCCCNFRYETLVDQSKETRDKVISMIAITFPEAGATDLYRHFEEKVT